MRGSVRGRRRARRIHSRRLAAFLLGSLVVVVAALFGFLHTPWGDYAARRVTTELTVGDHPVNLLVIANNARGVAANRPLGLGSAAGQADVLLVLHVDPMQRGIWAITIPRDALVAQPGWHNPIPKIKTLFFMGDQETPPIGPELTTRAVSALIGLPIDGYLAVNFAGFKAAVDFLGGLDVDVRERLYDPVNSGADFRPGLQHMNGAQVLAFVRIRQNDAGNSYRVNDYQRMDAEVQILSLLRARLLDPKSVALTLPRFVAHMSPDIATNLSDERLVRLGFAMVGVSVTEVSLDTLNDSMLLTSAAIPGVNAEGAIEGASYDVLDPVAICRRLARFGASGCTTGLPTPQPPSKVALTVYGSKALIERLREHGYSQVTLVSDPTGEKLVIYPPQDPAAGWSVARLLAGGGGVTVEPGPVGTDRVIARQ